MGEIWAYFGASFRFPFRTEAAVPSENSALPQCGRGMTPGAWHGIVKGVFLFLIHIDLITTSSRTNTKMK